MASFEIIASGDVGYLGYDQALVYPPSSGNGNFNDLSFGYLGAEKSYYGGFGYAIYNGFLRFDTSSIPDGSTILSATLRIYVYDIGLHEDDILNFHGEWYSSDNWPIDATDYSYTDVSDAWSIAINALLLNQYNEIPLTNIFNINKSGYTGFRTHLSGGQPSDFNYINFRTFGQVSPPQLVVIYSEVPTVPTMDELMRQGKWFNGGEFKGYYRS